MKKFTFYYQTASNRLVSDDVFASNQGKAIALFKQRYGKQYKIVRIVKNKSEPPIDNPKD